MLCRAAFEPGFDALSSSLQYLVGLATLLILVAFVLLTIPATYYWPPESNTRDAPAANTPLSERIKHVLTETRMVLPGAQALLDSASNSSPPS